MGALPRKGQGDEARPDSPDGILAAYARIQHLCLAAGVSSFDADDIAQDVFLWLLRNGPLIALPATPWLAAVARNFVRRYRRERSCRRRVEGISLADTVEPRAEEPTSALESKEILDRVAAAIPRIERELLSLIRSGYTLPQAARALKIPKGSRVYLKGRLVKCARRELRSRETQEPLLPCPTPSCCAIPVSE
jgi:DNA-directed RNA polymerase specialized sigma24 family protein